MLLDFQLFQPGIKPLESVNFFTVENYLKFLLLILFLFVHALKIFFFFSGHCSCCKRKLRKIPITTEDYKLLLESIEDTFGVDCKFSSYERKEVEEFKLFLKKCPSYSVVVDGLNLFYRADESQVSKTL